MATHVKEKQILNLNSTHVEKKSIYIEAALSLAKRTNDTEISWTFKLWAGIWIITLTFTVNYNISGFCLNIPYPQGKIVDLFDGVNPHWNDAFLPWV